MLKAPSRGHEWPVRFAGESDASQHAIHTFVWTARAGPQCVELLQLAFARFVIEKLSLKPFDFDTERQVLSRMAYGIIRGCMSVIARIEVADYSNSDVSHAFLLV
jgi:hypothetical protein